MHSVFRSTGPEPRDLSHLHFAIVGAGRLGSSLALALRRQGARLTGFVCATDPGRERAQALLGMAAADGLKDLVSTRPTHYFITVPDAALPAVAQDLAAALPNADTDDAGASFSTSSDGAALTPCEDAPLILHTSGATSISALAACERKGALVLVFHPLQTFSEPTNGSRRFQGAAVAVTPSLGPTSAAALDAGYRLARVLGAHPFLLADDKRVLYHAAACVASNYLVTLERCAELLFVQAGMPPGEALSLFLPLVQAAIDNIRTQGCVAALTGPLSRGDETTIAAHLAAMERETPALLSLYRSLGLHTLELVRARAQVGPDTIDRLTRLLGQ